MLILSRKQGESLEFPELGVVVKVVSLKRSKVQIGIEAPQEITVNRSEVATTRETADRGDDQLGNQRVLDDLARVEGELAALAELANSKDRLVARQVAADSIQRLVGIRRTLRLATHQERSEPRPISDFVKVRAEVLEHLRGEPNGNLEGEPPVLRPDSPRGRPSCVRQPRSDYAILPSSSANACVA